MSLQGTDNQHDEAMDLEPDLVNFYMTMADFGLAQQLQDCLVQSGFDSIESVCQLTDIKVVETFFQENHELFIGSSKYRSIYGIYASIPDQFKLIPGRAQQLSLFIKKCKELLKMPRKYSAGVKSTNAVTRRFKRSLRRRTPLLKRTSTSASTFSLDLPTMLDIPIPSTEVEITAEEPSNERQDSLSRPSTSSFLASEESMLFDTQSTSWSDFSKCDLDELYVQLRTRLKKWSATHQHQYIKNLRHDQHYQVNVEYCMQPIDETGLRVSTTCLICLTQVRMHFTGKTFIISNVTRHLENCVMKECKQKQAQIASLFGNRENPNKSSGNLHSNLNVVATESVDLTNEPHEVASATHENDNNDDDHNYNCDVNRRRDYLRKWLADHFFDNY